MREAKETPIGKRPPASLRAAAGKHRGTPPPALRPPQRRPLPSSAAFMVLPSGRAPSCGAAAGLSLPLDGSRDGGAAAAGGAALGIHPAGRRSPAPRPGPLPAPRRLSRLSRAPPARLHDPVTGAAPPPAW